MARYRFIDLARGIAIIGVVFAHHASAVESPRYGAFFLTLSTVVFTVVMPFFFMVSGVFLRSRFENPSFTGRDFLKHIGSSVLKPFYALGLLFFFLNLAAPKSMDLPTAREMVKGMLIMQANGDIMPSGVLWFLFVLFESALITYVLAKVLRINSYLILAGSALLKVFFFVFQHNYYLALNKVSAFYVYYVIGYFLSVYILREGSFRGARSFLAFTGYWIGAVSYRLLKLPESIYYDVATGFGIATSTAGSLALLDACRKLENNAASRRVLRLLQFCGMNSIVIYVFHPPVGLIVKQLNGVLGLSASLWGFALLLATGVIIPLLAGKALSLSRPAYRLLLGHNPRHFS